ncbi:carboxymuconolactone decarboxylase family protein [Paenibacillus sp. TH7-28]
MDKNRYQHGFDKLMEYTLPNHDEISTHLKISDDLKDIAPDVAKYIIEFAYEQRALVTISSLVTQGTEPQLEMHINTGLTFGLTAAQIVEGIIQLIPYTGFPRVLNALAAAFCSAKH